MSLLSEFVALPYLGLSITADALIWQKSLAEFTIDGTSTGVASNPALNLKNAKTGVGNGGLLRFYALNSTPSSFLAATIKGSLATNTAGSEDGQIDFIVPKGGISKTITLNGNLAALVSVGTGEFALGANTARWSSVLIGNTADTIKGDLSVDGTGVIVQSSSAHPLQLKGGGNLGARVTSTGDFEFTAGKRMLGDFNHATHSSRTMFKDATATKSTYVGAAPSPTATGAGFIAYGTNNVDASAYILLTHDNTNAIVQSEKTGGASVVAMLLKVGSTTGLKIETTGHLTFQTSQRLQGEFSNATHSSRTLLMNSAASQATYVGAVPSSGGTAAGYLAYGTNDPTASAYVMLSHDNTTALVSSDKTGAGTATLLQMKVGSNNPAVSLEINGDVRIGSTTALTTASTAGFMYLPAVAGVMTGVPTSRTGFVPLMYDSTNNKLGVYNGGAWKWTAALA